MERSNIVINGNYFGIHKILCKKKRVIFLTLPLGVAGVKHDGKSCLRYVVSTDPSMDRLLRLGGGMPGLGQVKESCKCELPNTLHIV